MDYFRNSMDPIVKRMRDSGINKKDVHDLVLVGGFIDGAIHDAEFFICKVRLLLLMSRAGSKRFAWCISVIPGASS